MTTGDNSVAIAAIALTGTIATGFFALIRQQNKVHEKVATSMDNVANSNRAIAKEAGLSRKVQEKGFNEAKERNGHLAELIIQQGEQTKALADGATESILGAVQNIKEQHVEHQHVDRETVGKKGK